MNIKNFMTENLPSIQSIIDDLDDSFNSYEFIQKFTRRFEVDYVRMLSLYDENPFRKVNAQIAKFLSNNESRLNIAKQNNKASYINVLGEETKCEMWKKF